MEFSSWALLYPWSNLIGIVFVSWVTLYLLPQLYLAWSLFFVYMLRQQSLGEKEEEIFF